MSGPLDSPQFWNRQCDAVSPLGEVRSASASGAGIDRSSPIAQRILSKFCATYGDNGKLPENGIRQDKPISTRSQLAGMLKLLKLTARGLGISQHRSVVAFDAVGEVLRVQDSKHIGCLKGFRLLDRATGMWTRSETDGSIEAESSGQTVETKAHSCNEIPSREHRALDGLNEVGPAMF